MSHLQWVKPLQLGRMLSLLADFKEICVLGINANLLSSIKKNCYITQLCTLAKWKVDTQWSTENISHCSKLLKMSYAEWATVLNKRVSNSLQNKSKCQSSSESHLRNNVHPANCSRRIKPDRARLFTKNYYSMWESPAIPKVFLL